MKINCPTCDRWYDLPTEPGDYACETCGRKYHISRTSTPPAITHHCPGCERLRAELLACCELHERSMMIIEEALGPDRPNGGTWRAQQIANEIIALRNFIAMDKEATTGERIRQMRLARGMTQDQLSSAAGISKGFLSDVENGKRDISSRNLLRIATALSASVDYLLQGVFCPDCEAAAREVADLKSDKAWAGKLAAENADELSNLRREHEGMTGVPITCACGDHIGYAEELGLSQDGAICGNCAVGRKDYDARTELATLRAGILRVIEDYPRDIKQDAEEALRALLAETEAK